MAKLLVVRHAQVTIDFTIPASQWRLSEEGIRAAKALSSDPAWADVVRIYHSPEPKAAETAHIISEAHSIPTTSVDDLRELSIPHIHPKQEFVRRVGAYLAGHPDPEFEPWASATHRIVGCIEGILREAGHQSVAVVSHGRILSVLFSHLLKRRVTAAEWQAIQLPDLSVIDMDTSTIERGFFSPEWRESNLEQSR